MKTNISNSDSCFRSFYFRLILSLNLVIYAVIAITNCSSMMQTAQTAVYWVHWHVVTHWPHSRCYEKSFQHHYICNSDRIISIWHLHTFKKNEKKKEKKKKIPSSDNICILEAVLKEWLNQKKNKTTTVWQPKGCSPFWVKPNYVRPWNLLKA